VQKQQKEGGESLKGEIEQCVKNHEVLQSNIVQIQKMMETQKLDSEK